MLNVTTVLIICFLFIANIFFYYFYKKKLNKLISKYKLVKKENKELKSILKKNNDLNKTNIKELKHILSNSEEKSIKKNFTAISKLLSIGEITAQIAHELNNPLSVISTYCDKLPDTEEKVKISEHLFKCKNIINKYLNYFKIDSENYLSLSLILRNCIDLVQNEIKLKNIKLELNITHKDIKMPEILEIAIINLLKNAIDAVKIDTGKIIIITNYIEDSNLLIINIKDNGIGIEEDKINKIFDIFYTTKIKRGGTGLGLSISKKIVESMEGNIKISSIKGEGTKVKITLPVEERL